jgi:hypothetical protein
MYTSALFRGRVRAVESSCGTWFVLSAKHGLLIPVAVVEPYDVGLKDLSVAARQAWSEGVLDALLGRFGDLSRHVFEIHAGSAYRENGLVAGLKAAGATVEIPPDGLNLGQQLAFYRRDVRPSFVPTTHRPCETHPRYQRIGEALDDSDEESVRLSFADLEDVLGDPLPASARKHAKWWANTDKSPQGRAWMDFGWRVAGIRIGTGEVDFVRENRSLNNLGTPR